MASELHNHILDSGHGGIFRWWAMLRLLYRYNVKKSRKQIIFPLCPQGENHGKHHGPRMSLNKRSAYEIDVFFMKCCSIVFWSFCFKQIWLYSGFCDVIYGEIFTWRIQCVLLQMGVWQPRKGQMQPIAPRCYQTHTFWYIFSNLIPIMFMLCASPFQTKTFYG